MASYATGTWALIETVFFLLTHLAFLYVIYWYIQNDGRGGLDELTGYLKIRSAAEKRPKREKKKPNRVTDRRFGEQN